MKSSLFVLSIFFGSRILDALSLSTSDSNNRAVDRREALRNAALGVGGVVSFLPYPAEADDTSSSDLSSFQEGPRGIKYSILKQGSGDKPVRAQKVYTKYTLWVGGFEEKQVDSNTGFLGRPLGVNVGVGQVIKGWDLVLLDMQVGEIRRIVVPSEVGYGDKGAGFSIPPKATLYFEVEMTDMDPMIELNDQQKKWLEDNPL